MLKNNPFIRSIYWSRTLKAIIFAIAVTISLAYVFQYTIAQSDKSTKEEGSVYGPGQPNENGDIEAATPAGELSPLACPATITHSSSFAVVPGQTAACIQQGTSFHRASSYWRAFSMSGFGVAANEAYNINSVFFGVDTDAAGTGTTQPATVRLYAKTGAAFPIGFPTVGTQIASIDLNIGDQRGILNVPLTAIVPAGTTELIMEVAVPDGVPSSNSFQLGGNSALETGAGYLGAAACGGNTTPRTTASIGFPDAHYVMSVNGSCSSCLASGNLDTTFDGDGKTTTQVGFFSTVTSVALQTDGKIITGGASNNNTLFALTRHNLNGSLDASFNGSGIVTTNVTTQDDAALGIAVQSDGKIVAVGYGSGAGDDQSQILRYTSAGLLDASFNGNGRGVNPNFGVSHRATSVVLQPDGKIVIAGFRSTATVSSEFAIARYNANGTLDTTFNGSGKVLTAVGAIASGAYAVGLQSDGKIVAAGYSSTNSGRNFAVVRLNANGSPDTTFDGDGQATAPIGSDNLAYSMAIQPDGKIVTAGPVQVGSNYFFGLVRFNTNGSLDNTFDSDGKVTTTFGGQADQASSVTIQPDGKIVAAGSSNSDFAVARYNSDGSLDAVFDGDGKVTTPVGGSDDGASAVALQSDGKIVVAGYSDIVTRDFALVRYNGGSCAGGPVPTPTPTPTRTPTPTPTPSPTPTPPPTPGPSFVVTNANDSGSGSLRQAVINSNNNAGSETITFDASFSTPRTITLASVITINPATGDSLTVVGPGANLLTISGNNAVRIFDLSTGDNAFISGVTMTLAVTGAIGNAGNLTVSNSTFHANTNNGSFSDSGAIGNRQALSLTVTGCTFTNNTSTGSASGAAIAFNSFNTNPTATITNSTFTNNSAIGGGLGGAIYISVGAMTITGSTFTGNGVTNTGDGGAIAIQGAPQVTINNSVLNGNSSTSSGGAIYYQPNGGTPFLNITNSTISNNTANADSNSTGNGGGIFASDQGSVTVTGSTISGNAATSGSVGTGFGGGIYAGTPVTLTNSTLSGNAAGRNGGGLYAFGTSTVIVNLTNSTIVGNTATLDGGGVYRFANSSNPTNFRNTIVANNAGGAAPDIFGNVTSNGFNLIRNTAGSTIAGTTASIITGQDPLLGPLANNGGATSTHALLVGSPAIDKGESSGSTIDQRIQPRPFDDVAIPNASGGNGADIGAFERQVFTISGRVFTPSGLALRNAIVSLTDEQGVRKTATTSPFGVYSFNNVLDSQPYVISVFSKRYRFAPKSVIVTSNLIDIDFIGLE